MGAAAETKSTKRSARRDDCDAAVVGGGPGVRILCAQDALWNYLRRSGGGDRLADLDGAVHGDYFLGRGGECRAGSQPEGRASRCLSRPCAWNAIPDIRAASCPKGSRLASKWRVVPNK